MGPDGAVYRGGVHPHAGSVGGVFDQLLRPSQSSPMAADFCESRALLPSAPTYGLDSHRGACVAIASRGGARTGIPSGARM